jgi:hypothetical protein
MARLHQKSHCDYPQSISWSARIEALRTSPGVPGLGDGRAQTDRLARWRCGDLGAHLPRFACKEGPINKGVRRDRSLCGIVPQVPGDSA